MKLAVLVAGVSLAAAIGAPVAAQPASAQTTPADAAAKSGDAYAQFMLGRHLETADDIPGAVAAFKRAAQLDPQSSGMALSLAPDVR